MTEQQSTGNTQRVFYNTSFTRQDVLNMMRLEEETTAFRQYIEQNVLAKWDKTKASPNRNDVFLDFVCQLWRFMNEQRYTAEQKSTLLSLSKRIFIDSFEKKKTSIESYEILSDMLLAQTKYTTMNCVPLFQEAHIAPLLLFFKDSFYRYYSLYEITMTKLIDFNIFTTDKFNYPMPKPADLSQCVVTDPLTIDHLQEYFIAERNEEEELDSGEQKTQQQLQQQQQQQQQQQLLLQQQQEEELQRQQKLHQREEYPDGEQDQGQQEQNQIASYVNEQLNTLKKQFLESKNQRREKTEQEIESILQVGTAAHVAKKK